MMGVEFQYGDRENFNATASQYLSPSITKVQFSFKYNFIGERSIRNDPGFPVKTKHNIDPNLH